MTYHANQKDLEQAKFLENMKKFKDELIEQLKSENKSLIAENNSLREEMKKKEDGGRKTLIDFIQSIKDYTHESQNVIGFDEREAEEFVDIFLNNYSK